MPRLLDYHIHRGCTLGLLFLHFLLGASNAESSANYMVLIPAELHFPSTETVCLLWDYSNECDCSVMVTLEVQGQVINLFPFENQPTSAFSCRTFMVPPPYQGVSEVATVKISIQGNINFEQSKNVLIQRIPRGVVVQTDKPTYRPSDTVHFRMVTLDENFLCAKKKYFLVELKDPKNNRINQWLDVTTTKCIADLSFQLSSEPILGTYTINVENGQALQTFLVQEEVLPRFEVTIERPTKIFAVDPAFMLKVCARYTYGRGVHGHVTVTLCRKAGPQTFIAKQVICTTVEGETDDTGCLDTSVNVNLLQLTDSGLFNYIVEITAEATESGTGVLFSTSKTIPVSFAAGSLRFEKMDSYYKTGHLYSITLVVQDRNENPLQFQMVYIEIGIEGKKNKVQGKTDNKGQARFSLETTNWTGEVKIQGYVDTIVSGGPVAPVYPNVIQEVNPYYSEAKSFLQLVPIFEVIPCKRPVNIRVVYEINQQDLNADDKTVKFYYVIIGKDGILLQGDITIQLTALNGALTIPITFTPEFGIAPKMIGFLILKGGTVAADRLLFNVEMCFPNKASLKFSASEASPKDHINLYLESSAGSMCALRAVDKSVQISYEDKELTTESVFKLFKYSTRGGYPDSVQEPISNPCWWPRPWILGQARIIGPIYRPVQDAFVDVFSLFKEVGLKILTNTQIMKPRLERLFCPLILHKGMILESVGVADRIPMEILPEAKSPVSASNDVVRKFFPDTWLWTLILINNSGTLTTPVTVPDTITQFNARVFCMGDIGFGLSPQVSLTVFKSFFVELSLPYSIVQGETFNLKASVFNYLKQCLKVQVTLLKSPNFTVELCQGCQYSLCVCANQVVTFNWKFTAKRIGLVDITVRAEAVTSQDLCEGMKPYVPPSGKLDVLQKKLLVKPSGIRKEITQNLFSCLKASNNIIYKPFSVKIPTAWVEQSESAYISVMGDILGSTLQNLDQLITMPYGCGEQNMLTMAPIVYVLDYLKSTGQLTLAQKEKAISYLQSGYQKELTYKHSDGSFSAFGESDGIGSTWLTAFVMKCFYQAKYYIYIDEDILKQTVTWLGNQQQSDGCFTSSGKLFHTLMKGGVEDDLSLSGYITSALLEGGAPGIELIQSSALSCLKGKVSSSSNPYTMALLAYTFALANDAPTRQMLLDKLFPLAVSSGGDLYWTYNLHSSGQYQPVSAAIEMSSYVLLALITSQSLKAEEILKASQIVSWLIKQQNSNGGFASTQDTVVAIQALAKYTRITFVPESILSVTVSAGQVSLKQFAVDKTNRLLFQTAQLPNIPGEYTLRITGTGCVYIQIVLKYNELPVGNLAAFSISAKIENCGEDSAQTLVISASYIGSRIVSNMVLIEVEMLSGFQPATGTAEKLLQLPLVKKVTVQIDSVIIYLEELGQESQDYYIDIQQQIVVSDLQPANVKIYDFYEPEENAAITYSPCP